MKTNAVIRLMSVLSICIQMVQSQTIKPEITPNDFQAKITTNSVILKQPHCYFTQTCTPDDCEIWLVSSLFSATSTFETDRINPNILSLSPYPAAFSGQLSKNYFLTKVGLKKDFPCSAASDDLYFVVGADGNCTTTNCNGVLPVGSTVRFKYVLVNGNSQTILNQTDWSDNITLYTPKDPQSIYDGLNRRSGAMVVITTILCVAVALLLLFFFIMLCLVCCGRKDSKPITVMNSFRIPHYDTHNLKDSVHPYDNPAYESGGKKYSTSDTLPKSGVIQTSDGIKLQKL
ncbi:uroplakin-3b-like [Myxocyprinus asiaticus]|uniref:uroplakin-3b-like n=1 Tax=Myxocyprinus asiaticus TaxID=70543 RepID=UPI002223BA6B|nr:uroplakin-3b-like [Myxocyprinus asiaticus]